MQLQVINKQLDESTFCSLCKAAMYFVEAEENDREFYFNECSFCGHCEFPDNRHNCNCESCLAKRKKIIKETTEEEVRFRSGKKKQKEYTEVDLNQLSFIQKLFLLSILDEQVQEGLQHQEFIDWGLIKYRPITPNFLYQNQLIKTMIDENILIPVEFTDECYKYYINVRLDGYSEPSLYSITHRLRQLFFENLTQGVPFKAAEEVKEALYYVLYQELVQFSQFLCSKMGVQISGSKRFQIFCFNELDTLAVGQLMFLTQNALDYLHSKNALQKRNDKFVNTHLLRATLESYRKRAIEERWETTALPRSPLYPLSRMSEILLYKFLGFDEQIFVQPVNHLWKRIEPRINFYSIKRCMGCGSNDLTIEYDQGDQVSMVCANCKHQDHYFLR